MDKIAILLTTFERDELLFKSIESILPYLNNNLILLIADQGNVSDEKATKYLRLKSEYPEQIHIRELPFDCGLSYARNRLVELAKEKECNFCILGSDSFLFNSTITIVNFLTEINLIHFDAIAFELSGCVCDWEANLKLIKGESFELDFIEKDMKYSKTDEFPLYKCDIARNFFIAKTMSLYNTKWDEDLKLGEHEDFFYRYKMNNYKLGWTNIIKAEKMKDRPDAYKDKRRINFAEGIEKLKKKYDITGWVTYKNLDRAKS